MPMPTVYAVGAAVSSPGAAVTPAIPAGTTTDDIVLLFHEMDPALNAAALGAITGYADVVNSPQSQTTGLPTRLTVRWHRATGPESGTISVPAVTNHQVCFLIGIRGAVVSGNPWNVTAGAIAASSATVNFPTLTTTAADCLILQAVTTGADIATGQLSGTPTNAALASITVRSNSWTTSGTGGGVALISGQKATAGAVGTTAGTLATANTQALMTVAIQGGVPVLRAEYRTAQLNVYRM